MKIIKNILILSVICFCILLNGSGINAATSEKSIVPIVSFLISDEDTAIKYPPEILFHENPIATQALSMPDFLNPVSGPAFSNRITRITDYDDRRLSQNYPKVQSWNCNGSYLRLNNTLLDGKTYESLPEPVGSLNSHAFHIDDRRWSHSKPNIMYGLQRRWNANDMVDNEINDNHYDFVSHDVENTVSNAEGVTTLIRFSGNEYQTVKMGPGEGNIDFNDSIVAFAALKHGANYLTVIVFDMIANTIIKTQDFPDIAWDGGYNTALDWVSVSPGGNYVLIKWEDNPGGGTSASSIHQYDSRTLNYIRKLSNYGGHGDMGLDANNREVYVQFEFGSRNGIWMYHMDDGSETLLLPCKYNGGHVSCRNYKRPGWCYMSTNRETYREVFAIKLDDSGLANRFAQTHIAEYINQAGQSRSAPNSQGGANPDGSKIIFKSNWDGEANGNGYMDSFVVEIPQ